MLQLRVSGLSINLPENRTGVSTDPRRDGGQQMLYADVAWRGTARFRTTAIVRRFDPLRALSGSTSSTLNFESDTGVLAVAPPLTGSDELHVKLRQCQIFGDLELSALGVQIMALPLVRGVPLTVRAGPFAFTLTAINFGLDPPSNGTQGTVGAVFEYSIPVEQQNDDAHEEDGDDFAGDNDAGSSNRPTGGLDVSRARKGAKKKKGKVGLKSGPVPSASTGCSDSSTDGPGGAAVVAEGASMPELAPIDTTQQQHHEQRQGERDPACCATSTTTSASRAAASPAVVVSVLDDFGNHYVASAFDDDPHEKEAPGPPTTRTRDAGMLSAGCPPAMCDRVAMPESTLAPSQMCAEPSGPQVEHAMPAPDETGPLVISTATNQLHTLTWSGELPPPPALPRRRSEANPGAVAQPDQQQPQVPSWQQQGQQQQQQHAPLPSSGSLFSGDLSRALFGALAAVKLGVSTVGHNVQGELMRGHFAGSPAASWSHADTYTPSCLNGHGVPISGCTLFVANEGLLVIGPGMRFIVPFASVGLVRSVRAFGESCVQVFQRRTVPGGSQAVYQFCAFDGIASRLGMLVGLRQETKAAAAFELILRMWLQSRQQR